MGDASFSELCSVVLCLIKSDNVRNSKVFEHLQVVFWGVTAAIRSDLINGSHECNELLRQYPVEIAVLNFFVVFVLLVVEFTEVVPAEADTNLQPLQAVEYRATVGAVTIARISIRPEASLIGSKGFPGHLGRLSQDNDHKGAHQKSCISLLVKHIRCVVEQLHVFVALICQHATELSYVLVSACKVQWSKV